MLCFYLFPVVISGPLVVSTLRLNIREVMANIPLLVSPPPCSPPQLPVVWYNMCEQPGRLKKPPMSHECSACETFTKCEPTHTLGKPVITSQCGVCMAGSLTLPDVCRKTKLVESNVLGCFLWGSRLWGTAKEGCVTPCVHRS